MRFFRSVLALVTLVAVAGCRENQIGKNAGCTSACFTVDNVKGRSPDDVMRMAKSACEQMGRKGKPEIIEQTDAAVTGHCPE
jgi:hypothetical protein